MQTNPTVKANEDDWTLVASGGDGYVVVVTHGDCAVSLGSKPDIHTGTDQIGIPLSSSERSLNQSLSNASGGECWARSMHDSGLCSISVTTI